MVQKQTKTYATMEETNPQPIEIHKGIGSFRAMILSPGNQIVGTVENDAELCDVLVQIKRRNLSGYYGYRVMEDGEFKKFVILNDGRLLDFGLTFVDNAMKELLGL